ncbi:hypothetical protein LKMONMHP_3898 [Methylobacterium organophilum]|uniref:Class I SAM-dependent methyltransferase n=1 Tax=Methylobacterium organophilum TaxID=410 RepID=A0ABQ4TCI3_METOR|nr:hypothetical protein LKMONMHP_3898 [Methylobacterium organophilum]
MADAAKTIIRPHAGLPYFELLRDLSKRTGALRYLEVGVRSGDVFTQISCVHAIGVDPLFQLNTNVTANKARVSLYQLPSDVFFQRLNWRRDIGHRIDLAFLDGMHLFEFLLRDFFNTEAICRRDSIIALHDCLPLTEAMADREPEQALERARGSDYVSFWTGDVWKVVAILRKYRPDLAITAADAAPTGLVLITNLDPSSQVLKRNYDAILREFTEMPNTAAAIGRMYADTPVTAAAEALDRLSRRSFAGKPWWKDWLGRG